ncbi:hypothetical protein Aduo_018689 [Ancylostoma duodenale]
MFFAVIGYTMDCVTPEREIFLVTVNDDTMHVEDSVVRMERLDRLKKVGSEPRKPNYLKLVVELLAELKKEIKEANARNNQLVEKV